MWRTVARRCFKASALVRPSKDAAGFSSRAAAAGTGRLEGKVALITGGASGLGLATAHEFIRQGARVVLVDIDVQGGRKAAEELGQGAEFVACDVTVEQDVSDAVDFAVERHGKLDIMHNNAGIAGSPTVAQGIAEFSLEEFDRVMSVNLRGTVAGIKHAARVMTMSFSSSGGSRAITCVASISGLLAGLGPHPYTVSKFAVAGLVKSAASELCRSGVRVNGISPFAIPTRLVTEQLALYYRGAGPEKIAEVVNGLGVLKGTKCQEVDVAMAAVYLASDEAKYVTGHNLVVDGGFTCFKNLNLPTPDQVV